MCGVDLAEDLPYNQLCVLHSSLVMRKMLTDKIAWNITDLDTSLKFCPPMP